MPTSSSMEEGAKVFGNDINATDSVGRGALGVEGMRERKKL